MYWLDKLYVTWCWGGGLSKGFYTQVFFMSNCRCFWEHSERTSKNVLQNVSKICHQISLNNIRCGTLAPTRLARDDLRQSKHTCKNPYMTHWSWTHDLRMWEWYLNMGIMCKMYTNKVPICRIHDSFSSLRHSASNYLPVMWCIGFLTESNNQRSGILWSMWLPVCKRNMIINLATCIFEALTDFMPCTVAEIAVF